MHLTTPTLEFARSFLEAQRELEVSGDNQYDKDVPRPKTMEEYIELLAQHSRGENLPKNWVPYSTFWLIDNNEFIGDTHIRHSLNDHLRTIGGHIGYTIRTSKRKQGYGTQILKFALEEAKKLGITKALITCDETNIASKKIIEANGGVYETATDQGEDKPKKLLYWITT